MIILVFSIFGQSSMCITCIWSHGMCSRRFLPTVNHTHSIFVCWGPSTFHTNEIFVQPPISLTRWVPHDGYIRHQNDHLSGRMTDISVMGEWQVAGVGGTRPLWNVLGEAIEGRFSFEAWNYLFSFQSYVRFEEFFCFPRFWKIWRQMFELWGFWFGKMFWGSFWKLRSVTQHFFANSDGDHRNFLKISFLFSKQSRFYLPDSYGDPKSEQSTLVMVRRKLEWKLDFRALARSSAEGPSIVVAIGTSRVRWSIVQKRKKTQGNQRVIVRRLNPSSSTNQRVLRSLFPRPDVATVSHFAVFVDVDVQLQEGQAAARGQRRKAVICDISGVDHWGVTNMSAPIWFTGQWGGEKKLHQQPQKMKSFFVAVGAIFFHRPLTGQGHCTVFCTWCNYRCWFCVGKAFWRWFYPRSRKRDHFQTLATGVPKLKTWLGTQRVKAGPPWGYFSHLWSESLTFFFVWKLLEKNEKWHHFCAHEQWWSPWRRKNVEKGHLTPSNLTFLLIAIDTNGFRRMKEEGQIYKKLPQIFQFLLRDFVMIFQSLVMIVPHFFDFERP